jgi:hypothetical protein
VVSASRRPNWNEALPIGNGRISPRWCSGGVEHERLQLNEDTVWAGEQRDPPESRRRPPRLPEIRRLLFEGKAVEAEALADKAVIAVPRRMPPYQPLGDLTITFTHAGPPPSTFASSICNEAVTRVRYIVRPLVLHARGVRVRGGRRDRRARSTASDGARAELPRRPSRASATPPRARSATTASCMEGQARVDPARRARPANGGPASASLPHCRRAGRGRVRADDSALVVERRGVGDRSLTAATDCALSRLRRAGGCACLERRPSEKPFARPARGSRGGLPAAVHGTRLRFRRQRRDVARGGSYREGAATSRRTSG